MPFLAVSDLYKSYGPTNILKGINIDINKGEFCVLLGPSGCGKSTLLNAIAGLTDHNQGDIFIDGKNVNKLKPSERDIAMVFQSYALYPTMNVEKNMRFGLEMRKTPKDIISEKIKYVAEILQLTNLLKRKPAQLSGGQRQRVAMGRAIVRDPKVFLFDEPLSNLDAKLRVDMRAEIHNLHNRLKATIVYVTHDQIEAMTLANKIAIMLDGNIEQYGTPYEVYNAPNNIFVAGFIGSPSMNFLTVKVVEEGSGVGGKIQVANETFVLPFPDHLKSYINKNIILGIRPENINNFDAGDSGEMIQFTVTVDLIEQTGPDTNIFFELNNSQLVARCRPDNTLANNSQLPLYLVKDKMLFFDVDTKLAIKG